MKVRKTKNSDLSRCLEIWKKSFPQDIVFGDRYFSEIHNNDYGFVCEKDEIVAGYLSAMPFEADVYGVRIPCRYYYGICVDPSFRRQGVMAYMLNSVLNEYKGFSLLIPAINGLYEKFGFSYLTKSSKVQIHNPVGDAVLCDDIKHLNGIYNEFRKQFDVSLVRHNDWWKTILTEAEREGFSVVANDGAYAIKKGDKVIELAYASEFYKNTLPIGEAVLSLPVSMSRGIKNDGRNYIALMLD